VNLLAEHEEPAVRRVRDPLPAGHLIGKFELRDAVGDGASGIVYRGWDRDLGMAVAVSEHWPQTLARRLPNGDLAPASPAQEAAYAASLQAFVRISRALAHCDHPSLVRVLQLQFAHGTAYRVMPWIDGEPLGDARRRQAGPADEAALRHMIEALLGALEALHAAGCPHGGVEPGRILMQRDGRPILLAPPTPMSGNSGAQLWSDLRDLAAVLRFWIRGAPGAKRVVEPSTAVLESLALHDRQQVYGPAFLRLIEHAAAPESAQRLRSVTAFREQLREAQRLDGSSPQQAKPARAAPLMLEVVDRDEAPEHLKRQIAAVPHRRREKVVAGAVLLGAMVLGGGLALWPYEFITDSEVAGNGTTSPPPGVSPAPVAAAPPAPSAPAATVPTQADSGATASPPAEAATPAATATTAAPAPTVAAPVPAPETAAPGAPVPAPTAAPGPTAAAPAPPSAGPAPPAATPTPTAAAPVPPPPPPEPAVAAKPPPKVVAKESKPARRSAPAPTRASATSPREICGPRTEFSLYRCMQQQCERASLQRHPQCVRFRQTDRID
jgi:cytoskeletal protein RodZ